MHRIQINRIMHIKRMHRIQMHIYNCIYRNAMNTNKTQQMHRIRCIQYNEYSTMHIIHSILCGKISQIPIAATSRSCDFFNYVLIDGDNMLTKILVIQIFKN